MTNTHRIIALIIASLSCFALATIAPAPSPTTISIPTDCPDDDYTIEDGYAFCDG